MESSTRRSPAKSSSSFGDQEAVLIDGLKALDASVEVKLSYDCTNSDYGDFYAKINGKEAVCHLCFLKFKSLTPLKYYPANIRSHIKATHPGVFYNDAVWLEECSKVKKNFPRKLFEGTKRKQRKPESFKTEDKKRRIGLLDPTP